MARNNTSRNVKNLLQQIQTRLNDANQICSSWGYDESKDDDTEQVEVNLDAAFEQSLVLMETLRLSDARQRIERMYGDAKKDLTATKYSVGMGEPYLVWSYKLSQILGAIEHPESESLEAPELVRRIFDGFHRVALSLRQRRYNGRERLLMEDEYDVQYLIGALLAGFFSDVRAEEYTPSYGGKSSRMDFLLNDESIVVETKMMRDTLNDKLIADELIIDKERYAKHLKCKTLICFVYDPTSLMKNPAGLEADLSREDEEFSVQVLVRPKTWVEES